MERSEGNGKSDQIPFLALHIISSCLFSPPFFESTQNSLLLESAQQKPIIIQGRLYRDVNNNNQWDAGIDLPFSNEAVLLYLLPSSKLTRRNAPGEEIASNVTDSRGQFTFTVSDRTQVPPGANLGMAIRSNPDVVLKTFEAGSGGEMEYVDTPVEVGTTTVVGRVGFEEKRRGEGGGGSDCLILCRVSYLFFSCFGRACWYGLNRGVAPFQSTAVTILFRIVHFYRRPRKTNNSQLRPLPELRPPQTN